MFILIRKIHLNLIIILSLSLLISGSSLNNELNESLLLLLLPLFKGYSRRLRIVGRVYSICIVRRVAAFVIIGPSID